jgi:hypothetical protein
MSHFAKVTDGVVEDIIVAEQDFIDSGAVGDPAQWVQTSFNTRGGVHYNPETGEPSQDQTKALRKNYAAIGGAYDPVRNAFLPLKPFASWVLNESSCIWEPPVKKPSDGQLYFWNEEAVSWVLFRDV